MYIVLGLLDWRYTRDGLLVKTVVVRHSLGNMFSYVIDSSDCLLLSKHEPSETG